MKNFLVELLDYVYKKKCYFCHRSKEGVKMCSECSDEMDFLPIETNRKAFGIDIYCAGRYESNLQKLIRGLKYHQQKDLAYYLAKFMYEYWLNIPDKKEFYQIIPIPLFKTREKHRKYNHMTLVANEFSKLTGYEVNSELVTRIKDTKPQYKLNKTQRMDNLKDAFLIDKTKLLKGDILLLDDICTTGSTFENIIEQLQKNKINDMVCLAATTPFFEG